MATQEVSDVAFDEELPFPIPFSFFADLPQHVIMLYTSAKFYRTAFNTNIVTTVPIGNNFASNLWFSSDAYLPTNTFNSTKPISEVSFPNLNSVQINYAMQFYHSIEIDLKLAKNLSSDGYQNFRKIQCLPVKNDGTTPYDNALIACAQPGPNNRITLSIQGEIAHTAGDIIKLKFNIIQDDTHSDQTASVMTIYRVTWNLAGLKVI